MKINIRKVNIFKIENREGFAAVYRRHLTEGKTKEQAYERMVKALGRSERKR